MTFHNKVDTRNDILRFHGNMQLYKVACHINMDTHHCITTFDFKM